MSSYGPVCSVWCYKEPIHFTGFTKGVYWTFYCSSVVLFVFFQVRHHNRTERRKKLAQAFDFVQQNIATSFEDAN